MSQETLVTIANLALDRLGGDYALASLDDKTKEARLCKKHIFMSRRSCLTLSPWKFAGNRQTILPVANSAGFLAVNGIVPGNAIPAFGYSYAYLLPSGCIHVRRVNDGAGDDTRWKVEGRYVLTDYTQIDIEYTQDIEDPSLFHPQFCDTLAAHLACKICFAITRSDTRQKEVENWFMTVMRKARHSDAIQQSHMHIEADLFNEVRLGPNRGFVRDPMT